MWTNTLLRDGNDSMPTRRQWLCSAGLGCGLLALTDLLSSESEASALPAPHFPPRAKNIIWLFMHGGPSQVDTFDPKPALKKYEGSAPPADVNDLDFQFTNPGEQKLMPSAMSFSRCGESGLEMCDAFRHLQSCADDIAVVRSCHHDTFNHTPGIFLMNTGHARMGRPSMGSWLSYGLGSDSNDLPTYVVMTDGPLKPGPGVWGNGYLPAKHQGTTFHTNGPAIRNLDTPASLGGSDQRQTLDYIQWLNRRHRASRTNDLNLEARIASYELAYRMQSAAPEAVSLDRETQATRDMYGPGFGETCLTARRLVERGVRFVQIYNRGGKSDWDTHDNNHNRHRKLIEGVDQGCAALLSDLKARGLLESTLVIWSGEFGRTPTTEDSDGRDHNPYGFSLWMAGGGVQGGQVIGATDELGFRAVDQPVDVHDLHATLLKLMGIDHERLTFFHESRPQRLTDVAGHNDIADLLTGV